MKEYKPTLKLVKNKWYVSMTVPFELHSLLSIIYTFSLTNLLVVYCYQKL